MPKIRRSNIRTESGRATNKESAPNYREQVIAEMRSFGFDGVPFVDNLQTSTENRKKRGKMPRQNRYYHYCGWSYALMNKNIGPPEAEFSFPQSVLRLIRHLVPDDIKGEIREHAFQVSIPEFCEALELPNL